MQNFNIVGHIKMSQIKIHLIKSVEKYLELALQYILPMTLEKPTQVQMLRCPSIGMMNVEGSLDSLLRSSTP